MFSRPTRRISGGAAVRCIRWFYDVEDSVMAMFGWDGEPLDCPECGAELDDIGCEKTVECDECGSEWKYGDDMDSLVRVKKGDSVYWDR